MMTIKDRIWPAVGVIAGILGLVSFFMPWYADGCAVSGFDLLTGETAGLDPGMYSYVPTVVIALFIIELFFSIRALFDRSKGFACYGILLFGFVTLGVSVIFGNWVPEVGAKAILSGASGLYLAFVSSILYIGYGIAEYYRRPLQ